MQTPKHSMIKRTILTLALLLAMTTYAINSMASIDDLLKAIASGNSEKVEQLLNSGANANEKLPKLGGNSLLIIAMSKKNDAVTLSLLKHGADPNAGYLQEGKPLFYALHLAIQLKNLTIAKALIDAGADLGKKTESGETPLNTAASMKQTEIATYIVDKGGKLDTPDSKQRTALHWAAVYNNLDLASALVKHGANINAKSVEGYTPLYIAKSRGHKDLVAFLEKNGAK